MSLTGGNTLPNIGKRNWQLVTLASGLAIAVSAAIGLGAFETDRTPAQPVAFISQPVAASSHANDAFNIVDPGAGSTAIVVPQVAMQSAQPLPVVYIVGSQEYGLLLAENIEGNLLAVQGFDVPVHPASFLVVSTPKEEQALNETIMEQQLLTEPTLNIVDIRR